MLINFYSIPNSSAKFFAFFCRIDPVRVIPSKSLTHTTFFYDRKMTFPFSLWIDSSTANHLSFDCFTDRWLSNFILGCNFNIFQMRVFLHISFFIIIVRFVRSFFDPEQYLSLTRGTFAVCCSNLYADLDGTSFQRIYVDHKRTARLLWARAT